MDGRQLVNGAYTYKGSITFILFKGNLSAIVNLWLNWGSDNVTDFVFISKVLLVKRLDVMLVGITLQVIHG